MSEFRRLHKLASSVLHPSVMKAAPTSGEPSPTNQLESMLIHAIADDVSQFQDFQNNFSRLNRDYFVNVEQLRSRTKRLLFANRSCARARVVAEALREEIFADRFDLVWLGVGFCLDAALLCDLMPTAEVIAVLPNTSSAVHTKRALDRVSPHLSSRFDLQANPGVRTGISNRLRDQKQISVAIVDARHPLLIKGTPTKQRRSWETIISSCDLVLILGPPEINLELPHREISQKIGEEGIFYSLHKYQEASHDFGRVKT